MLSQLTKEEKMIYDLALPHLQVMSNELHTREVVRFCLQLLKRVDGQRHIVIPAAILHDTGWAKVPESVARKMRVPSGDPDLIILHEEFSALIAQLILGEIGYKKSNINEIVAMLVGHDTRKNALSLNDKILKDADKLSRFSKEFLKIWPLWGDGSAATKLHDILSDGVKNWFFLSESREIAEMELGQRIQEGRLHTT